MSNSDESLRAKAEEHVRKQLAGRARQNRLQLAKGFGDAGIPLELRQQIAKDRLDELSEQRFKTLVDEELAQPQEAQDQSARAVSSRRGYAAADAELIPEMRSIIKTKKVSDWAAAMRVVHKAAGNGSDESKAKRLVDRLRNSEQF